jgi:hypothetical protein
VALAAWDRRVPVGTRTHAAAVSRTGATAGAATVRGVDLTTVADDLVVLHDGAQVLAFTDLPPDTTVRVNGIEAHTLPRPGGELLCRFATVNDVHFGELEAGRIDDSPLGPVQRIDPGEPPYPETMSQGAVDEIAAIDPAAVVVKGDLTMDGAEDEFMASDSKSSAATTTPITARTSIPVTVWSTCRGCAWSCSIP